MTNLPWGIRLNERKKVYSVRKITVYKEETFWLFSHVAATLCKS